MLLFAASFSFACPDINSVIIPNLYRPLSVFGSNFGLLHGDGAAIVWETWTETLSDFMQSISCVLALTSSSATKCYHQLET